MVKPCDFENGPEKDRVCAVNITNGFGNCQADKGFGYNGSNPCIFLKLNKVSPKY